MLSLRAAKRDKSNLKLSNSFASDLIGFGKAATIELIAYSRRFYLVVLCVVRSFLPFVAKIK